MDASTQLTVRWMERQIRPIVYILFPEYGFSSWGSQRNVRGHNHLAFPIWLHKKRILARSQLAVGSWEQSPKMGKFRTIIFRGQNVFFHMTQEPVYKNPANNLNQ